MQWFMKYFSSKGSLMSVEAWFGLGTIIFLILGSIWAKQDQRIKTQDRLIKELSKPTKSRRAS